MNIDYTPAAGRATDAVMAADVTGAKDAINEELLDFLQQCPTSYHTADTVRRILLDAGYEELTESAPWVLKRGGRYLAVRGESSVIAFRVPRCEPSGFMIAASHTDSPTMKIKVNPEMTGDGYIRLNVEKYGGIMLQSWFDRPLSVAGRVVVRTERGFESRLVCVDRDLLMIPRLAIHMDRKQNEGQALNLQKDMLPIYGLSEAAGSFMDLIASEAGCTAEDILSHDLFLYVRGRGTVWGARNEFLSAGHLDDLQCGFADLKGFLAAESAASAASGTCQDQGVKQGGSSVQEAASIPVLAIFDNEEVGSRSRQGADSGFLSDVLHRICNDLSWGGGQIRDVRSHDGQFRSGEMLRERQPRGGEQFRDPQTHDEHFRIMTAGSFMISADNAHAVHPNYPEKADPVNRPALNKGPVLKYNASLRYTTDAVSAAFFKELCRRADVPFQEFTNRSDILGGSTLGHQSMTHFSIPTADVGLPQLAMHSAYETAGTADTEYMIKVMKRFFSTSLRSEGRDSFVIG